MYIVKKFLKYWDYILIFFLTFLVLNSSLNTKVPARDSGAFLYVSKRILNGELPYKDLWDHKPPLIYFINAFGLFLTKNSLWGLWVIESLFLFTTVFFCFKFLKSEYGKYPAFLGTFTLLIWFYDLVGGGNLIEEYALPFQFLILWLFVKHKEEKLNKGQLFLIGFASAIIFFLRPNLIGLPVALLIYYFYEFFLIKNVKLYLNRIYFFTVGFLALSLLIIFYLITNSLIGEFIDQVFVYNFFYTKSLLKEQLSALIFAIKLFPYANILLITSYIGGIYYLRVGERINDGQKRLISVIVVLLPIEVFLATLPGRNYGHYFISWIPVVAVLSAQLMYLVSKLFDYLFGKIKLFKVLGISIFTLMLIPYTKQIKSFWYKNYENRLFTKKLEPRFFRFNNFEEHKETLDFIKENSNEDDTILVWGSESAIYFLSNRVAPTRYFYQYALFTPVYADTKKIREFTDDIKNKNPKLVVDTSASTFDKEIDEVSVIPPLDRERRKDWIAVRRKLEDLSTFSDFFDFVEKNYEFVKLTYEDKWYAYKLRENATP